MVQRSNPSLANELFTLRIESGFDKQIAFSSHLGLSMRHYQRLEAEGVFTRKMIAKIRLKYPSFGQSVAS